MVCSFFKKVRKDVPPHTCNRKALRKNGGLERVAKLRFTTRSRFVRSRLMPKSSAFRHSRIYRRKIRGACPRIFRIFIEIGLRPKSLIGFCNSLKKPPSGFGRRFLCATQPFYSVFSKSKRTICIVMTLSPNFANKRKKPLTDGSFKS